MRGRVPGVGLGWRGAVSQCSGGMPYHHCGLTRIGNLEVFVRAHSERRQSHCNVVEQES